MRILLLSQYFQPEPLFKGLPLAQALRDRGHDVEVLTGFPNYPGGKIYQGYRQRFWQKEQMDGIQVIRVPVFPSHDRSGLRRMLNYVSLGFTTWLLGPWLVKKPDIIYVYNLVTLLPTARWFRILHRCRVVLDVQDLWPESVTSSGMMKSKMALGTLAYLCRAAYRSCDRLMVLSPGFKRNLSDRGVAESKIDVVYNWCDEAAITVPSPNSEIANQLGFSGFFNIVFAGTMGVMQSLDCAIEAARLIQNELPDVKFTFVGGGIDVERLKGLSASLKNVQFLPKIDPTEIGKVFANADALLVHLKNDPIFRITVPSKIQAYMYAGKPILCGVSGDAAELVKRANAGIAFGPDNAVSMADAIRQLRAMSTDQLSKMGLAGKEFYHEHLCFRKGVDQMELVFQTTEMVQRTFSHENPI